MKRVVAFTGQSLSVPDGAAVLMRLGSTAYEAASREETRAALEALLGGGAPEAVAAHARPAGARKGWR